VAPHRYRCRVYYEDTDAGGVVYHARYLGIAERARTEAMRDAGIPHSEMVAQHGLVFMVRRIEMEYLRPARLDEEIEVVTESLALGAATTSIRQDFRVGDRHLVSLRIELACVRQRDGRPARIPERWRAGLAPGGVAGVPATELKAEG
jgi:acyl-CoA thioester hydrolase